MEYGTLVSQLSNPFGATITAHADAGAASGVPAICWRLQMVKSSTVGEVLGLARPRVKRILTPSDGGMSVRSSVQLFPSEEYSRRVLCEDWSREVPVIWV